jgi:ornithine carbamoyltransferase
MNLGTTEDTGTPTLAPMRKDFLSVLDLDAVDLEGCLAVAIRMKADRRLGPDAPTAALLKGRYVAMLFEKPSLRTRTTFEIAVRELGGEIVALQPDVAIGRREPVADVARNLERWVHAVVVRTFSHRTLEEFAAAAGRLHVVNALTDEQHPCQALADCITLKEHLGSLAGRTLAFVGDGNNIAASLAHACAVLGIHYRVASPAGYELPAAIVEQAAGAARHGARLRLFREPAEAVAGADAVYTDTWTSMGQEAEAAVRRQAFAAYQVNDRLMAAAKPGALFMHCLPAHRGEEVTAEVFESPASVVFDQAENRLHGQKALLSMLLAR